MPCPHPGPAAAAGHAGVPQLVPPGAPGGGGGAALDGGAENRCVHGMGGMGWGGGRKGGGAGRWRWCCTGRWHRRQVGSGGGNEGTRETRANRVRRQGVTITLVPGGTGGTRERREAVQGVREARKRWCLHAKRNRGRPPEMDRSKRTFMMKRAYTTDVLGRPTATGG